MTWLLMGAVSALATAAVALGAMADHLVERPPAPQHCAVAAGPLSIELFGEGAQTECRKFLGIRGADGTPVYRPARPGQGTYVCLAPGPDVSAIVREDGPVPDVDTVCQQVSEALGATPQDFR